LCGAAGAVVGEIEPPAARRVGGTNAAPHGLARRRNTRALRSTQSVRADRPLAIRGGRLARSPHDRLAPESRTPRLRRRLVVARRAHRRTVRGAAERAGLYRESGSAGILC